MRNTAFLLAASLCLPGAANAAAPCDGIWQKPLAQGQALLKKARRPVPIPSTADQDEACGTTPLSFSRKRESNFFDNARPKLDARFRGHDRYWLFRRRLVKINFPATLLELF